MSDPSKILAAFRPGEGGRLGRLHPATKLWLLTAMVATPLLSPSVAYEAACLFQSILLSAIAGSRDRIGEALRGSYFFIALIFVINYVFSGDLGLSASMVIRFLSMLVVSIALLTSMDPAELGDLLGMLRLPKSVTFSLVIALRFIPVMADDIQTISAAQASRGYRGDVGGPLERIRRFAPILLPAIVSAVRRSQILAEAMESRCFGSPARRTSLVSYEFGVEDLLWVAYPLAPLAALALVGWNPT